MASIFARREHGWPDDTSKSFHPTHDASSPCSLLRTHPSFRPSDGFSPAAAATNTMLSPSSPSLDDIKARLQDVMRSIDDTLVEAEASPPELQPYNAVAAATFRATRDHLQGTFSTRSDEKGGNGVISSQLPPVHSNASAPSSSVSSCGSSAVPTSRSSPQITLASGTSAKTTATFAYIEPSLTACEGTALPASTQCFARQEGSKEGDKDIARMGPARLFHSSSAAVASSGRCEGDEDTTATTTTSKTGLSATYKAKLDYWRAGGHRGLYSVPTEAQKASSLLNGYVERGASKPTQWIASEAFPTSSHTTLHKSTKSTSLESLHAAGAAGGGKTRLPNTSANALTSSSVTTMRSSRSFSAASSSSTSQCDGAAKVAGYQHPPLLSSRSAPTSFTQVATNVKDSLADRRAVLAAAAAASASRQSEEHVVSLTNLTNGPVHPQNGSVSVQVAASAPLPDPSTVPSLSARLAVLRAAEALQRSALKQRDGVRLANEGVVGSADKAFGSHASSFPLYGTNVNAAVPRHTDPLKPKYRSLFEHSTTKGNYGALLNDENVSYFSAQSSHVGPATVDTPISHRAPLYTRDRPRPSPQPTQPMDLKTDTVSDSNDGNHADQSGGSYTGTYSVNRSHNSDVLVRSPIASRANSPGVLERRSRREVRQDETSRIVRLALARQAATEEVWREGQLKLRTAPPRPRSLSPTTVMASYGRGESELSHKRWNKGEGKGSGKGNGGDTITTEPLDALQARLTSYALLSNVAVAAVDTEEVGDLPMQEELAVRARLAARRNGALSQSAEGTLCTRGRSSEDITVQQQQRRQRDRHVRLSKARDRDTAQHLHGELARQTKVQADAQARLARADANVPASEIKASLRTAELHAIRAHAHQLEKLRQRVQQDNSCSTTNPPGSHTSPQRIMVKSTNADSRPATVLPDGTSSTAPLLKVPEVLPSVHHLTPTDSPNVPATRRLREATEAPREARTAVATKEEKGASASHLSHSVTTLSTAAAVRTTSVEVDSGDDNARADTPLFSVSATSVDDREPTPERAASPKLPRKTSCCGTGGMCVVAQPFLRHEEQQSKILYHGGANGREVESRVLDAQPVQLSGQDLTLHRRMQDLSKRSEAGSASDGDDDKTAAEGTSRHDWASSTQLPVSRPPREAPTPPPSVSTRQQLTEAPLTNTAPQLSPQTARPSQSKIESAAMDATTEVARQPAVSAQQICSPSTTTRYLVSSSFVDEPPSPLPTKPPASDTHTRFENGCGRVAKDGSDNNSNLLERAGGPSKTTVDQLTPPHASLPVEDAERDIISSSPSAVRHHTDHLFQNGNSNKNNRSPGSLSLERLAAIQLTRLHVSPARGTAWQNEFGPSASRNSLSRRPSSLSTSSSSSDFMGLSPLASHTRRHSGRQRQRSTVIQHESEMQTLVDTTPPSSSPTRGQPSHGPRFVPTSTTNTAAAEGTSKADTADTARTADPLSVHRQAIQQAANVRTALRARAVLREHGVSVGVRLAGRRLPAVVKLSKDKRELLFYLERITEAAGGDSQSSTPYSRSLETPVPVPLSLAPAAAASMASMQQPPRNSTSPQQQQKQLQDIHNRSLRPSANCPQSLLPGTVHGPVAMTGPFLAATAAAKAPQRQIKVFMEAPASMQSNRFVQQPPSPSQRGFLYSVAPSVHLREPVVSKKTPPTATLVKHKVALSGRQHPPPPGAVKVPAGAAPPSPHPAGGPVVQAPMQSVLFEGQGQRRLQRLLPVRINAPTPLRQPSPKHISPRRAAEPLLTSAISSVRTDSPELRVQMGPSRIVHVRELHHFPCRFARLYIPYGVMGYESDCGVGGPDTWEDVHGVLCGPAAYEVLRRYGCPLFAHMRGCDYMPYRVYVIIPEFERVDVPQDAVLLVLDFKQRVDWVLFLLAMQLNNPDSAGGAQAAVLSYGRVLWMLAAQRLQRARALRGLNPFESRVVARQRGTFVQGSPRRQEQAQQERRGPLLLGEEDDNRKGTAHGDGAPQDHYMNSASCLIAKPLSASPRQRALSPSVNHASSSSLRFATPSVTVAPVSLLRSPRRSRVVEARPLCQPAQTTHTSDSPRRVASSAAAAPQQHVSNMNDRNGKKANHFPSSVHIDGETQPRNLPLRRTAAAPVPKQPHVEEKDHHAAYAHADEADAGAHPVYEEEKSKPRFRWLKRVASSLSGRRNSATHRHAGTGEKE